MKQSVSIVVMAYNEVESLEPVVCEIHQVLERSGRRFELLIVDDGSSDGTWELANRLASELGAVRPVRHELNRGLGGVYRTGLEEAREDLISFFPADGQFPAAILEDFLPITEDVDLILGYLDHRDDSVTGKALSWVERCLYRVLFGRLPRFQGVFLVRRAVVDRIPLTSEGRGWAIVMELIIRAQRAGCRIRSVPTELRDRMAGRSKVRNVRSALSNLVQVLALARRV